VCAFVSSVVCVCSFLLARVCVLSCVCCGVCVCSFVCVVVCVMLFVCCLIYFLCVTKMTTLVAVSKKKSGISNVPDNLWTQQRKRQCLLLHRNQVEEGDVKISSLS